MERSQEILDLYMRYSRGELWGTPADQMISNTPAVSMIGTDPTEWSTDCAQVVQAADMQGQAPQAWAEGDLGWVNDQPRPAHAQGGGGADAHDDDRAP